MRRGRKQRSSEGYLGSLFDEPANAVLMTEHAGNDQSDMSGSDGDATVQPDEPAAQPDETEEGEIVQGIWAAFKDRTMRTEFKKRALAKPGVQKDDVDEEMRIFNNYVKDGDNAGIYSKQLAECRSFEKMEVLLGQLVECWSNRVYYGLCKRLFPEYLDFLRDFYKQRGHLNGLKARTKKLAAPRILFTYGSGIQQLLRPNEALKKVIKHVGAEQVAQMSLKVGGDKLLLHYHPHNDRYYDELWDGWWLNTRGTSKAKYQQIFVIIQRHRLDLKVEFLLGGA